MSEPQPNPYEAPQGTGEKQAGTVRRSPAEIGSVRRVLANIFLFAAGLLLAGGAILFLESLGLAADKQPRGFFLAMASAVIGVVFVVAAGLLNPYVFSSKKRRDVKKR